MTFSALLRIARDVCVLTIRLPLIGLGRLFSLSLSVSSNNKKKFEQLKN
jgi:hypothetical protein